MAQKKEAQASSKDVKMRDLKPNKDAKGGFSTHQMNRGGGQANRGGGQMNRGGGQMNRGGGQANRGGGQLA